jgi:TonB-dependent Receptor Plug Domain.
VHPLLRFYVVDGIPYDGAINAINPNDIESLTVIKDASAGAFMVPVVQMALL